MEVANAIPGRSAGRSAELFGDMIHEACRDCSLHRAVTSVILSSSDAIIPVPDPINNSFNRSSSSSRSNFIPTSVPR